MFIKEADIILYVARLESNPIILNPERALPQLRQNGFYRPTPEEIDKVISSSRSIRINVSKMYLESCGNECGVFRFYTNRKEFDDYNEDEQTIIGRIFGQEREFARNMKFLRDNGIHASGFHIVLPDKVGALINEGQSIAYIPKMHRTSDTYFFIEPQYKINPEKGIMRAVPIQCHEAVGHK